MGMKYLWDTNIVIYFLQGQFSYEAEIFIDETLKSFPPAISVITEIELLCWNTTSENELKVLKEFIRRSEVIELTREIKDKTADIRRKNKAKLPDAIIAATAITNNFTLLTNNVKDFCSVHDLVLLNPSNL